MFVIDAQEILYREFFTTDVKITNGVIGSTIATWENYKNPEVKGSVSDEDALKYKVTWFAYANVIGGSTIVKYSVDGGKQIFHSQYPILGIDVKENIYQIWRHLKP